MTTPATTWQRPPFEPGNTLAERHGAYSPRRVEPIAGRLVDGALTDPDLQYLAAASYRAALWAWARAEAAVQLLDDHIATITADGIGDLEDKRVAAAHALLDKHESRAEKARARLGLDPLSRAKLGKSIASTQVDLVAILTANRAAAEQDSAA